MQTPFAPALRVLRSRGQAVACALTLAALLQPRLAHAQAASPAEPQKEKDTEVFTLPQFVVSTEKDRGYMSTNASSGTKLNQPLQEIPATISIVNQELIRDLGANTVQELLRYAPGVTTSDNKTEDIQVRGFNILVPLLDGFREPQGVPSEQMHVERVEILKGPAGILYGNTFGLGGIINRISKKPDFSKPITEIFVQVRDNDYYQASLDFGRKLGEHAAYRVITNWIDSHDFQDFVTLKREYIRPTVEWRPTRNTTVRATLEYGRQITHAEYNADFWNPYTDALVKLPQKFNPGEDLSEEKSTRRAFNLEVTQNLGRQWLLRNALQLTRHKEDKGGMTFGFATSGSVATVIVAPDGTPLIGGVPASVPANWLVRSPQYTDRLVGNYFNQLDLVGKFETGSVEHTFTTGLEVTQDVDDLTLYNGLLSSIDLSNLSYAALSAQYGDEVFNNLRYGHRRTETWYWAGYVSDSMKFLDGKLGVNLALRYDDFQQISATQIKWPLPPQQPVTDLDLGRNKFYAKPNYMPRGGLVYNFNKDVSLYAGYSEAYIIVTNSNPDGSILKPETGEQYEVGLKAAALDGRLAANLSVFKLKRGNIVEGDPARAGFLRQIGEQESKGFEASSIAVLSKNLQLMGSYAFTKGETSSSTDAAQIGLPLQGLARHRANALIRYTITDGEMKGLGFGLGANYAAGRKVWTPASLTTRRFASLPDATVVDAMLFYSAGKLWDVSVNIRNIFDRDYYATGNEAGWLRGTPRGFVFSARRRF
ncbi:MAG: TonB-dependent receptor [Nocardioides sp.]